MKMRTIIILIILSSFGSKAICQNNYNRNEARCILLSSERSNVLIKNDTNFIEYHFNGFSSNKLYLKGDSNVYLIEKPNMLPKVFPLADTFELGIYNKANDSLLYSEKFISVFKDSLPSIHNTNHSKSEFCDYIFSSSIDKILYRSKENRLFLDYNNLNPNLISFEVTNGIMKSSVIENLIITPGKEKICEVRIFYNRQLAYSKQFIVYD
jgi:hypothetical protein